MNGTNLTTDKGHNHSSQRLSVDPAHRGASNATSLTAIGQQMEELWSNRHRSAMGTFIVPLRGNTNETSLTADQGSYHSTQRRPFDPARRDGSNAPSLTEHGRIFGKVAPIFIVPLGSDVSSFRCGTLRFERRCCRSRSAMLQTREREIERSPWHGSSNSWRMDGINNNNVNSDRIRQKRKTPPLLPRSGVS